jgi:hypothetical protein
VVYIQSVSARRATYVLSIGVEGIIFIRTVEGGGQGLNLVVSVLDISPSTET